ncbi:hypothetical protein FAI40_10470 (plasmid) [Acetobacteraceae bacterium]|nr:hypothetical protein FAI40_10365 [Acetobacteraceae bacterium]QCE35844.1 hypothetical protein FAI40_10470 [Acetobacteraceae bacterium]
METTEISFEENINLLTSEIKKLRKQIHNDQQERTKQNKFLKILGSKYCVISVILLPLVTGFFGYYSGKKSGQVYWTTKGYNIAYAIAKDEKASANWASSGDGLDAYLMYKTGALSTILHCSGIGWHTEIQNKKVACFPGLGVSGWWLPNAEKIKGISNPPDVLLKNQ